METAHIQRLLTPPERSFFLFGPPGAGKSTWLRDVLPQAQFFDLLDASLYLELAREPARLEALAGRLPENAWVVLDEVQKIPDLLDEAHRLIEKHRWRFALCGLSTRKLRRKETNLLGGRALTHELGSFSWREVGAFDLPTALQWGLLPWVYLDPANAADILNGYVNTYIKQEIKEEGIVRSLPPFLRFLGIAGQLNGQIINAQNIARQGYALETFVHHELRTFNHVHNRNRGMYFYRTGSQAEIDFVIETRKAQPGAKPHIVCIEVKLSDRWDRRWEKPMRSLHEDARIQVDRIFGVYTGARAYHFEGVDVLPVEDFSGSCIRVRCSNAHPVYASQFSGSVHASIALLCQKSRHNQVIFITERKDRSLPGVTKAV